jgi:hypothetical protein
MNQKDKVTLTITSLLSILLFLFHLADDIIRGFESGGLPDLVGGGLILGAWLVGTLLLAERRSGYAIMLLGGVLAAAVPYLHMRGAGVGGELAKTSGAFFFVWTLLALGVTGPFSVILSVRGLWSLRSGQRREAARDHSGAVG